TAKSIAVSKISMDGSSFGANWLGFDRQASMRSQASSQSTASFVTDVASASRDAPWVRVNGVTEAVASDKMFRASNVLITRLPLAPKSGCGHAPRQSPQTNGRSLRGPEPVLRQHRRTHRPHREP